LYVEIRAEIIGNLNCQLTLKPQNKRTKFVISLFIFVHHQQQTPRQFIDSIFAAGFKTASLQQLAGQADQGDFFAVIENEIDGVVVISHGGSALTSKYD